MDIDILGIDLAKRVLQLRGADRHGDTCLQMRFDLRRNLK